MSNILWHGNALVGNSKSCTWGGTTSCPSICWRPASWKAALQRRTRGPWCTAAWTWESSLPWQQREPTAPALPAGRGRHSLPSTQHRWNSSGLLGPGVDSPLYGTGRRLFYSDLVTTQIEHKGIISDCRGFLGKELSCTTRSRAKLMTGKK